MGLHCGSTYLVPVRLIRAQIGFHHVWHVNARALLSFFITFHQSAQFGSPLMDLAACVKDPKLCYTYRAKLEAMAVGTPDQKAWAKSTLKAFLDCDFMP